MSKSDLEALGDAVRARNAKRAPVRNARKPPTKPKRKPGRKVTK